MINYFEPRVNWVHLAHEQRRCKTDIIFIPLQAKSALAEGKGNRFYELMNLMNLERDFTAGCLLFCKKVSISKLNYVVEAGIKASKFISSFKNKFSNLFILFITILLLKTVINDEYMNTNEQTYGLLPLFSMWLVNS